MHHISSHSWMFVCEPKGFHFNQYLHHTLFILIYLFLLFFSFWWNAEQVQYSSHAEKTAAAEHTLNT